MQTYQLVYRQGPNGAAVSTEIECATDRDATAIAEQVIGDRDCIEVWQAGRPIARVGNPRLSPR